MPEDGIACKQHQSPPEVPWHHISHPFKEVKPFPCDDHQEHRSKDQAEERENRASKRRKRPGGRLCCLLGGGLRDRVACFFHCLANGGQIDLCWVNLEHRLFRRQEHTHVINTWKRSQGMLHMHGAFCAIHSANRHFKLSQSHLNTHPFHWYWLIRIVCIRRRHAPHHEAIHR